MFRFAHPHLLWLLCLIPLLVLLFVIMNLAAGSKLPSNAVIEFSGDFQKTRSFAVWEMVINLTVSVVAIFYILNNDLVSRI